MHHVADGGLLSLTRSTHGCTSTQTATLPFIVAPSAYEWDTSTSTTCPSASETEVCELKACPVDCKFGCKFDKLDRAVCSHTIQSCRETPFGVLVGGIHDKLAPHAELICNGNLEALRQQLYGKSLLGDAYHSSQRFAQQPLHPDALAKCNKSIQAFIVVGSICQERGERSMPSP